MFGTYNSLPEWGSNAGNKLSEGLNGLAHNKMQEVARQRQRNEQKDEESRISQLLQKGGFSPEESGILAITPANERNQLLMALAQGRGQGQGMQQEFQPGGSPQELIQQLLGQQLQKGQGVSPYAPDFEGKRQQEYGGQEQQQTDLLKQLQQALGQPGMQQPQQQSRPSFVQNLGQGAKATGKESAARDPGAQKYLETEKVRYDAANELEQEIDEAIRMFETGKFKGGVIKRGLGSNAATAPLLNKDDQDLLALLNRIVIKSASTGKGLPSQARLRLEDAAKVNLGTKPKAALNILRRAKEASRVAKRPYEIANDLIAKNNYVTPQAIGTRVHEIIGKDQGIPQRSSQSQVSNPNQESERASTGSLNGISESDLSGLPDGTAIKKEGKIVGYVKNGRLGK